MRGFLDIRDTVACVRLAVEHPAQPGEFRVFNQFTEQFACRRARRAGRPASGRADATIERLDNPRVEAEGHYYHAAHTKLLDLGLRPHLLADTLIDSLLRRRRRAPRSDRPHGHPAHDLLAQGSQHHRTGALTSVPTSPTATT